MNESTAKAEKLSASQQREPAKAPYTVTVGDTTVRLRFNGHGDLTARLAGAFNAMQG